MAIRNFKGHSNKALEPLCGAGYKEVVSMLIRAASSQDQLQRILDAFDVDGDTVWSWLLSIFMLRHLDREGLRLVFLFVVSIMIVGQFAHDDADDGTT